MSHKFDQVGMDCCTRCGMTGIEAVESGKTCIEENSNVIAITHIVLRRRMAKNFAATPYARMFQE